jgi:hypothetical protein
MTKQRRRKQYEVRLPQLHSDQKAVTAQIKDARFVHLRAGRRWGKSHLLARMLTEAAIKKKIVGYFAPTYKLMLPVWEQARKVLRAPVADENKAERRIDTVVGGRIEFWSLDNPDAGRSRGYDLVVVDEAGLVRNLETIWREALIPTLIDRAGRAVLAGTPKGRGDFWRIYQSALDDPRWVTIRRSTSDNPRLDPADVALLRSAMTERAARQELDAEFLDDGGAVFRNVRGCVGETVRSGEAAVIGVDWGRHNDATVFIALDPQTRCVVDVERLVDVDFASQRRALTTFWQRNGRGAIIAEANSIGQPNIEELQRAGLPVQAFTTTAASKPLLIDTLALALEQRTIVLPATEWLLNELEIYSVDVTASGRARYSAPEGGFDDGVIALALAVWGASRTTEVLFDV